MQLCTFSKSEIHHDKILPSCPLDLTAAQGKKCPCKKRLYHVPPADLRVLSCQFPEDYRGELIREPAALAARLKSKPVKKTKTERSRDSMGSEEGKDNTPAEVKTQLPAKSNAPLGISVYDRIADPMAFIGAMGQTLYDSKMFGCANPAQGRALAFGFLCKRIDPFDFRRRNHIIGGNISMSSEAMLADFRTICGGKTRLVSRTYDKASIELQLGKDKHIFEFTWAEAQKEDYVFTAEANKGQVPKYMANGAVNDKALKDNWSTPRRRMQMLWARVISDAVGAMAPEVSGGMQTPEELGTLPHGEIMGQVVDAEFTVTNSAVEAAASGEAAEPPFATDPVVEKPADAQQVASRAAVEGTQTAVGDKLSEAREKLDSVPPSAETQAANMSPDRPAVGNAAVDQQLALLKELGPLKRELLTDEQYKKVLADKKVSSAKEMSIEQLAKLVDGLKARKAKAAEAAAVQQPAKKDELSDWANKAAGGQPGN